MNKFAKLITAIAFIAGCSIPQQILLPGVSEAPYLYGDRTEQSRTILEAELIFNNLSATQLKPGVSKKMINQISNPALRHLATELYNNTYKPGLRLASYEAYLSPKALGRKYRIGDGFSKYEGITGIVLEAGVHPVFVGTTH